MKNELLYDNFIEEVRCRVPENEKISNVLADILLIEKEAVYRRLRREVPFTFSEIAAICSAMRISLDHIIDTKPSYSRPAQIVINEFLYPDETNYRMLENFVQIFDMADHCTHNEVGMCCNIIPQALYLAYEKITKFYYFKWRALYSGSNDIKPYSHITFTDRLRDLQRKHLEGYKKLNDLIIIWDNMVINYIVNDITYFSSIRLITPEEKKELKEELLLFLDDMELLAEKGGFESGTKIHFYISNIEFDTSYIYAENNNYNLGMIKSFILNAVCTVDKVAVERIKSSVLSFKRVSTLISECNERQRIHFFDKQRELIGSL
ncbi:MAG: hypothetical protein LIO79_08230 [Rikenellaceae bacterium]|nr:hypothetical protein [Rikenellaceae bacterium]